MINCLICQKNDQVKFLSEYLLEIHEDHEFFKDAKIYRCNSCDFAFVNPMPNQEKIDEFYEKVYTDSGLAVSIFGVYGIVFLYCASRP